MRYRLGSLLGRGGMGQVFRAHDEILDRDVAIKQVVPPHGLDDPAAVHRRTLREARAAARLSHPGVVQVFDVLEVDGDAWIVMEYVPSRSLHQVLIEDGTLEPVRAARIGLDLLAALVAADKAGVEHRDVKPANVLLADDGRVLLTDFGIATMTGDSLVTSSDVLLGSPEYMSPERTRNAHVGLSSDLWSLGATLYAAVEGRSPFHRATVTGTLTALALDPPDPALAAGPLRPVLEALLQKDPGDRPSAAEAARMLGEVARTAEPDPARPLTAETLRTLRDAIRSETTKNGRRKRKGRTGSPDGTARGVTESGSSLSPAAGASGLIEEGRASVQENSPGLNGSSVSEGAHESDDVAGSDAVHGSDSAAGSDSGADQGDVVSADGRAGRDPASIAGVDQQASPGRVRVGEARNRRRIVPIIWTLGLAVVLVAATIMVVWRIGRSPERRAAAPSSSVAASLSPEPSSASVSPSPTSASPVPTTAVATGDGRPSLPSGWQLYRDKTGFSLYVPTGWTRTKEGSIVYFRHSGHVLGIDQSSHPKSNPVADWTNQAAHRVGAGDFPSYHQIKIQSVDYFVKAADWEFTFTRNGTRQHVNNRGLVTSAHQAYGIYWQTSDAAWSSSLPDLKLIFASFRPA